MKGHNMFTGETLSQRQKDCLRTIETMPLKKKYISDSFTPWGSLEFRKEVWPMGETYLIAKATLPVLIDGKSDWMFAEFRKEWNVVISHEPDKYPLEFRVRQLAHIVTTDVAKAVKQFTFKDFVAPMPEVPQA